MLKCIFSYSNTVDGSEIRRSPAEVGSLSDYLRRVFYIPGGAGFLPSTMLKHVWIICLHDLCLFV